MTTLQLNPDTSDGYEVFTLAEMRQKVFDAIGLISPFTGDGTLTLGQMRAMIINRLGLAVALLANFDTFDNILTDVYRMGGYASIGATHPPGVDDLLTTIINDAQRTLFARVELDQGGNANPPILTTGVSTKIDATAVRLLAIAELKAHQGKPDAQGYAQQVEKYLSDLTQRTPPNIIGQVNAAIVQAHQSIWRRWELGNSDFNTELGNIRGKTLLAFTLAGNYNTTSFDSAPTMIDAYPVYTLALANLKKKIGHADADVLGADVETYMKQLTIRFPPNAITIVNRALKDAQDTLYRRYSVFRMERWYTWTMVPDQRFYPLYGYDGASSQAPTNLVATQGSAVTSHDLKTAFGQGSVIKLQDGTIFVGAGFGGPPYINRVASELYDPTTGTFAQTGNMVTPRNLLASARLNDGTVLLTGGQNGPILSSAEIYDPTTQTFVATSNMTAPRQNHTATLLQDGRVLVIGGRTNSTTTLASAEIYDPATGLFTATGSMAHTRESHRATLLADGRVLVCGGASGGAANTAEIYDPVAKTFSPTGTTMTVGRTQHAQVLLADGTVLVAGGVATNVAEIYDPFQDTFTAVGNMSIERTNAAAILLKNQKVLVAGGQNVSTGLSVATAEVFDPAAGTFSATSNNLPWVLEATGAAELPDQTVLIPGGMQVGLTTRVFIKTAAIYDPDANTFAATGSLTAGTTFYEVTAFTANGESLPSAEAFIMTVPANTSVRLNWTPVVKQPFVVGFNIYRGKSSGAEGFIASVPATVTQYIDEGTIPQGAPAPTENTTPGNRSIDPRHVAWVGLSLNGNVWNPLIAGIPPIAYTANISGIPTNYEIRDAIELWPPPRDNTWQLQVKGYFPPQLFETDDDVTTIDWQAILYQTVADVLPKFPGRYDKEAIADARRRSDSYIKELTAGTHKTNRYIPGSATQRNLIRPVFVGSYETFP